MQKMASRIIKMVCIVVLVLCYFASVKVIEDIIKDIEDYWKNQRWREEK